MLEYFSIFGGLYGVLDIDYFDDFFKVIETHFVHTFEMYENLVSPSYIIDTPYRELLMAIAQGDGKFYKAFRKAKLSDRVGEMLVKDLLDKGVLRMEYSRESPLRRHSKHKLKKEHRAYVIQDKLRFNKPFLRFWFAFVSPYQRLLREGKKEAFMENFRQHYERLRSLVFEELCNALLLESSKEKIFSSGSYWNIHSEFDVLAITEKKKIILGECKYKERKVCKNELTKLEYKAMASNIPVETYVLFSKSGFSKELLASSSKNLRLFDLASLSILL
ncbi:FIG00469868: hypothetical protein [hydrothermal vent metagenome]|uniref:DUF234 domain-containing protein n=1 Tax=hydrothermal vent metagenome TaxID=652676 RepID=A0A1W1CYG7_9ZZZZ